MQVRENVLFLVFTVLAILPAIASASNRLAVERVLNGNTFLIAGGDTVRIASIKAPETQEEANDVHAARPGEPLGQEAKAELEKLLRGHSIKIEGLQGSRDRHNRLSGQVYREDGIWVEGEMLKSGMAMVYSPDNQDEQYIRNMLAAEREAIAAERGIWADPYFRVLSPKEAGGAIGHYRLVEGKIVSVHEYHGSIYINFSDHWKGNFAGFISHKYAQEFATMNLAALTGKTIYIRGWITYHNAPSMDLTHSWQLEALD